MDFAFIQSDRGIHEGPPLQTSEKEIEFKFYIVNMTVLNRQKFTEEVVNGDKSVMNEPELMESDDDTDSE